MGRRDSIFYPLLYPLTNVSVSGIDSEGHAANFVETEQIVLYEGAKASFVQVGLFSDCCNAS